MLKGSIVAIVTPYKDNKVDKKTLQGLVNFHIENGTDAILPCGTTGESPTLTTKEHKEVIKICIEAAKDRIPILAGTGSNSTAEAINLTKHAQEAGADAALIVSPYYNKPTQEGLYQHFKTIAKSVDIPIILYNIPSRCGINITPDTMKRLAADCKNIIGVKEAAGSVDQMQAIRLTCPKEFLLLSGDDALTLPLLSIGGVGVVSVVANIIPKDVSNLVKLFNSNKIKEAQELHFKMLPLIKAMFLETNPTPVKAAMGILSKCDPSVRLPLCSLSDQSLEKLKTALKTYGLLS